MTHMRIAMEKTYNNKKNHLKSIIVKHGVLLYAYTSPKNYHINVFVIFIFIYIYRLFYCVFHLFTNIDKIPQKNQRDIQNMLVGMSEKMYKEMVKEMMQHLALVSTCYQLIL
jgi:hypothetical protein